MRSASNPIQYQRVIVAEALLLTLLIHAGLLFLFSYEKPEVVRTSQQYGTLTLLDRIPSAGENGAKFMRWMTVHDPSVIAGSASPIGYSALMPRVRSAEPGDVELPARELAPEPFHAPAATLKEQKTTALFFHGFNAAPQDPGCRVYPLAVLNGKELLDLSAAPEIAALPALPDRPVSFELFRANADSPVRFEFSASSGNTACDMLAVRLVLKQLANRDFSGKLPVAVFWRGNSGGGK